MCNWTFNGSSGSLRGISSSGRMGKPNFCSWFVKGFLSQLGQKELISPKNHQTHQQKSKLTPKPWNPATAAIQRVQEMKWDPTCDSVLMVTIPTLTLM